jgi:hypothetical protein
MLIEVRKQDGVRVEGRDADKAPEYICPDPRCGHRVRIKKPSLDFVDHFAHDPRDNTRGSLIAHIRIDDLVDVIDVPDQADLRFHRSTWLTTGIDPDNPINWTFRRGDEVIGFHDMIVPAPKNDRGARHAWTGRTINQVVATGQLHEIRL